MTVASANLVRVVLIPESSYGETPGSGNFKTVRFTGETLSGTPDTTESKLLRIDRQPSGQVVTGLQVGGNLNIELAKDAVTDLILSSAMNNAWDVLAPVTVDLDIVASTKRITRDSGDWSTALVIGDIITLAGMAQAANNTQVMIVEFISATVIRVEPKGTLVDETGSGSSYTRADKLTVGTSKKSFSMEKCFTDLTTKAINYRGMIVNTLDLTVAYGELISGVVGLLGNNYEAVSSSGDMMTDGRTIDAAATTNTLNGSVDMPILVSSAAGTLGASNFQIKSVAMKLDNGDQAQTAIGVPAPFDYSLGTCKVGLDISAYLDNNSWSMLAKKLSQDPIALGFMVQNAGGFYGFYMPAVQVSFEDPAAPGQNQDVLLNMKGMAKVGNNQESNITIYRSA